MVAFCPAGQSLAWKLLIIGQGFSEIGPFRLGLVCQPVPRQSRFCSRDNAQAAGIF